MDNKKSIKRVYQTIRKDILVFFSKQKGKSLNSKQIASAIELKSEADRHILQAILDELVKDKKLKQTDYGKYASATDSGENYTGVIETTRKGAGYIRCEELDDEVYIHSKNMHHALNGDTVSFELKQTAKGERPEGKITAVIQRAKESFAGRLKMSGKFGFVIADNQKMYVDIFISANKLNGAKDGDKVIARLSDWPETADSPFGEITDILGVSGENEAEMHAILAEFDLPYKFPVHVEKCADKIPVDIDDSEIKKRRDFRDILTFTIDPDDAKDFDDALSFRVLSGEKENAIYEIGVHIADVSHYVVPGSEIDREATDRATSVYLVDRVVPMLPEILSNQVCSLRPNEDKLTFSVVFKINAKAEILEEWHGRTVIHSNKRFTYEEAQKIIEGEEHELWFEIREMDRLAKILREKRMKNGALELHSTEVKFILDAAKKPIGVYTKISKDANKLIEEFMLLANKSVARLIGGPDPKKKMLPMVYRVHDEPGDQKVSELMEFIKHMGYKLDVKNKQKLSSALNKLFESIKDKREVEVIQNFSIRCMAKAIYDINNIGHYGLAFDYYTHFTSPIRRYPDLLVHRILDSFLKSKESYSKNELEKFCKHCSSQEKRAADAERMSVKYKQVEFMSDKIGKVFSGVVTGVTEWGLYVETDEQKCEGMVSLRSMTDDYYYYDDKSFSIIGRKYKEKYRLGTEVMIKVLKADLMLKQLDYQLIPK